MQYIKLGTTDLKVSRICLGCMAFGDDNSGFLRWSIDEEKSRKVIKKALEGGINFFDTAITFQAGSSERILGKAIHDFSKRENVVIATKFLPKHTNEINQNIKYEDHIVRMCNMSLKNLGTDYIDLFTYHMWDDSCDIESLLIGLNRLIKDGKIRHVGLSNCFAWQVCKANAIAKALGLEGFCNIQNHYNLITREDEREMIPYCREDNISYSAYSPLAAGRLARDSNNELTYRQKHDLFAQFKYDNALSDSDSADRRVIKSIEDIAHAHNCSMAEISLAWVLSKVDFAVVGASTEDQIADNIKACEIILSAKETELLEQHYEPHRLTGIMAFENFHKSFEKELWMHL